VTDFALLSAAQGFHPIEYDGEGAFRWTRQRFYLPRPQGQRYLDLVLGRQIPGRLTIEDNQRHESHVKLACGWHAYSLCLGRAINADVTLTIDPPLVELDRPLLGVMVRSIAWHDSAEWHDRVEAARANAILNDHEYRTGVTILRSVPPYLRVTLEVKCNIANKEPCVYCAWKWMKNEEIGAPAYDLPFLKGLGSYLSLAKLVTDCSYGEPPLNREFAQIVELIATSDRAMTFASNGSSLDKKIRRALLGRNVFLYVSIDSATSLGYARYRDDGFDRIIANLKNLCEEKKSHANLPHVTVSFIVMHSNKGEIESFLTLMHSIGVDRVKLMSLSRENCMDLDGLRKSRDGFVFDYESEVMFLDELDAISQEASRTAQNLGINLYIDWDDFPNHHDSDGNRPLCSEPWKTLYVLNRGILPCCYGRKPLARWSEQGSRSVRQFIDDTFNGATMQTMRHALAAGVFPRYCLSSPNCPIVRRATADASHLESQADIHSCGKSADWQPAPVHMRK
jgi:MoaA/NifB/PqqE/SkfB family radical SAM enzyme